MNIGFDLISDLYLSPGDKFNWEGKATSLYCLIAGNISYDLRTIGNTLSHLSEHYQGVFYTLGSLEFQEAADIPNRIYELSLICKRTKNVVLLQQQVVIIDGIAVLGCNGWSGNTAPADQETEKKIATSRHDDFVYLKTSIEKLQKHVDVTRILLLTNSVPGKELYFGEIPKIVKYKPELALTHMLDLDSEAKISHWAYGTYEKSVDTNIDGINYITNPSFDKNPYWAKRIDVEV